MSSRVLSPGQSGISTSGAGNAFTTSGSKSTSAVLDRVRITTSGGAETFDAGTVNINYGF